MVNVVKGVLIECDPTVKQFLLHLDEKNQLGQKFIIKDLDATHLFISSEVVSLLQEKMWELMDQLSFPMGAQGQ
eukprot:gene4405-4995_t